MSRRSDIPLTLLNLARRQGGLVSAAQATQAGVGSSRRSRLVQSGRWARVAWSVYEVEPTAALSVDARRYRSAWTGLLAFGPDAIAVGACALVLHGVAGLPVTVPPEVALARGHDGRDRDGIRVRCFGDPVAFPSQRHGAGRVATLPWALAQAIPELETRHAVAVLDDTLRRGLLSRGGFAEVRGLVSGRRGAPHARPVWALVDARAESPLESFARLDCVSAGIPPDDLQVVVRGADGRVLGRADLGWRLPDGRWLLVEIDGRDVHEAPQALLRDRRRQNALLATGQVTILRFTSHDLGPDGQLTRSIRRTLSLAGREPVMRTGTAAVPGAMTGSAAGGSRARDRTGR